jgi:phosphorylcholine metabolism protein LicD
MLGYKRAKKYIPWDLDMDIFIGKKDAENLIEMEKTIPNIFFNNKKQKKNEEDIFIVLTNDHNTDLDPSISSIHAQKERGRFNCEGKPVNDQIDNCSFNELFGRVVYNNVHCDLFVWFKSKDNQDKCSLCKGEYCVYSPTYLGSDLPETKKIELNGNVTRIIKDDKQLEHILTLWYGKDYMKPDHKCENGKWTNV